MNDITFVDLNYLQGLMRMPHFLALGLYRNTDLIGEIMGPEVTLIDTGEEAAWELKRTLKAKDLLSDRAQEGTTTLYASDQPEDFGLMAKHFLQEELTSPVLQVNIDRY